MKKRLIAGLIGVVLGIFVYGISSKYSLCYKQAEIFGGGETIDSRTCWGVNSETQIGKGLCINTYYFINNSDSYFNEYWGFQFELINGEGWTGHGDNLYVFRPFSIQRYFNKVEVIE